MLFYPAALPLSARPSLQPGHATTRAQAPPSLDAFIALDWPIIPICPMGPGIRAIASFSLMTSGCDGAAGGHESPGLT